MPITQALIDALTESVNAYGRKMISDGALLGFNCWFDPARNPETELAAGHLLSRFTSLCGSSIIADSWRSTPVIPRIS